MEYEFNIEIRKGMKIDKKKVDQANQTFRVVCLMYDADPTLDALHRLLTFSVLLAFGTIHLARPID